MLKQIKKQKKLVDKPGEGWYYNKALRENDRNSQEPQAENKKIEKVLDKNNQV